MWNCIRTWRQASALDYNNDENIMESEKPFKPNTFLEKIVFRGCFALGFLGIFALLWWFVRQR